MRLSDRITMVAALAVSLAATALAPLYSDLSWLPPVLGAILVVAAIGLGARRAGAPGPMQPLLTTAGAAAYLMVVFAGQTLSYGFVPGSTTWHVLTGLVQQGTTEVQQYAAPVPTRDGVVLLAVGGVAAVAIAVDLLAAVLGRAALAGLPLLVLFAVPSAVHPGGIGTLPFLLTSAGWLCLLLIEGGDRVDRWGAPMRTEGHGGRAEDRGVARVGRRIGAVALGAAVVVPVALPGLNGQLVSGQNGIGGHGRGHTATTYNPITRLRGDLIRPNPTTLLHYTTTDPAPDYLRLTTLDRYDGTGWSSSQLNGDPAGDAVQRGIPTPLGLRDSSTQVRVVQDQIAVSRLHTNWLPVPFPPTSVQIRGAWVWDSRAETVFSSTSYADTSPLPYKVTAARVLPDAAALHDAESLPESIAPYTDPPHLTPYVADQTLTATKGAHTELDRARALQSYFLNPSRFQYSTSSSVPQINSPDALERFLRGGRGFCEQYASAMAAMLRYLGIPSRVAVGFTPGRRLADGSYVVTTQEAHAWPEVWFAAVGWVRFEPTPRAGAATIPPYAQADTPGVGTSSLPPAVTSVDPSTVPSRNRTTGKDLDKVLRDGTATPAPSLTKSAHRSVVPALALGVLAALLLLAVAPRVLYALRRRNRRAGAGAAAAWGLVREDAWDVGHRWRDADSPRAAAARLAGRARLSPPAVEALFRLSGAAERARYGRPGTAEGPGRDTLGQDLATVRAALLSQARPLTRLRAVLVPPSTVRWATRGVVGASADLLDLTDAAFAWIGRTGRRRRIA